jgi:2-polyprenyl-3-methyl-5-hydroxy-6-metoxy-1,4-benzoquinol methylase
MANDRQFQLHSRLVATWGVKPYRDTIPHLVDPADSVLEIGCEWGTTSALLHSRAARLVATDLSRECIERARDMHPQIEFRTLDAFDIRAVERLGTFDKIYIDVSGLSGYRSTLDVLSLLNTYSALLEPKAIVVKSGSLLNLARRLTAWEKQ